jgi:prephenate dehydrogenase
MVIDIIGNGNFGMFLRAILSERATITTEACIKILAIPYDSYRDYMEKEYIKDNHYVNVCSIQEPTNKIIKERVIHSSRFTGIHPLFGNRTPVDKRKSIITHEESGSAIANQVIQLFKSVSECYYLDDTTHDKFMAKTHGKVIQLQESISKAVEEASEVPDFCLPNSFMKLKEFSETFLDMPLGTKSSILANKYIDHENNK